MCDKRVGVYQIVNTATGGRYIGSSKNLAKRLREHKNTLDNDTHRNRHLLRAWRKYGSDVFVFSVLEYTREEDRLLKEQEYLDAFRVMEGWQHLYNIQESTTSGVWSPETVEKRSGVNSTSSIFSVADVKRIRERYRAGETQGVLASEFNCSRAAILKIVCGKSYKNCAGPITKAGTGARPASGIGNGKSKVTKECVLEIRRLYALGNITQKKLAEMFGVNSPNISHIVNRTTWAHV